jgi:hypothetical protein
MSAFRVNSGTRAALRRGRYWLRRRRHSGTSPPTSTVRSFESASHWIVKPGRNCYTVFRGLKQRLETMSATGILKSAFTLALYITATTTALANAQEATFSEGERLGLAACLSKCPDNDKACNNRCISLSQTKGRVWSDDVRACIRGCRAGTQMPIDKIFGCITGCRLDRIVQ